MCWFGKQIKEINMTDLRLRCPLTMLVVAPSQSGKTVWVSKLLKHRDTMFDKPLGKIFFFIREMQPLYQEMKEEIPDIEFLKGYPNYKFMETECTKHENPMILVDDNQCQTDRDTVEMFTVGSTRFSTNIVLLWQTLFDSKNPHCRPVSLNTRYFCLLRNPRDKLSISILAKQAYPRRHAFLCDAFEKATLKPYSYMFLDLTQQSPDAIRVRENIFGEDDQPVGVYVKRGEMGSVMGEGDGEDDEGEGDTAAYERVL